MCSEGYSTWSVIPSIRPSVRLSGTPYSATTRNKAAKKRYQRVQYHTVLILNSDFRKSTAFKSYGVKTSEQANMLISMAYLDQILPVSSMVEAVQVTRRVSMWSWFAKITTYRRSSPGLSPCVHCFREAGSCISVPHAYFSCTRMYVYSLCTPTNLRMRNATYILMYMYIYR